MPNYLINHMLKKLIVWLSVFGIVLAPAAPTFAATTAPTAKLTAQELVLKKKLTQVKYKQQVTKARIKANTVLAKSDIKKVKKARTVVIKKRAAVKTKLNALKK